MHMKNVTKFWFLEDFNLMKKMGRMKLMQLCELLEMTTISKGDELHFNRDDQQVIFFLKSGTVKVVSAESQQTKYVIKKGNIFGELPLFDETPDHDKAIALEEGVICFIEQPQMKEMLDQFPSLKNDLLKFNGLRIRKLERRLSDLLYKDSKTRIQEYILDYVRSFGTKEAELIVAKNLLTHADVASLTNTSRQTVSNVLSSLRKEGVIDYNSKTIQIIDTKKQ